MGLVWNFGILTFFCETFWGDQKHWNLCQYLVSVSCGTCIFFVNEHLPTIMLFLYYWYQAIHCVSSFNCIWFIDGDWISDSQFIGCFEWTSPWSFFFFFLCFCHCVSCKYFNIRLGNLYSKFALREKTKTFEIWLQIFICILFNGLKYIQQEIRYQWMVDYSRWTGIVFKVLPCYFLFFHIESEKYCQLIWWLLHTRTISACIRK